MGLSSDGILFFGINLGDDEDREEPLPWEGKDGEGEWEDFVAKKAGIEKPTVEYTDETEALYDEYFEKRNKLVAATGCDVLQHGADSCLAHAIVLKHTSASRGYPVKLEREYFEVSTTDVLKIIEFCQILDVKWEEPSWILTSWLG